MPRGYSPQQWASVLRAARASAASGHPIGSPYHVQPALSPDATAIAQRYLSWQAARPSLDAPALEAPAVAAAVPPPAALQQPHKPGTVEEQIHALPKHLLDSDSGASSPLSSASGDSALSLSSQQRQPSPQRGDTHAQALPSAFSGFSLYRDRRNDSSSGSSHGRDSSLTGGAAALSANAAPFVPRGALTISSARALCAEIAAAPSPERLQSLLQRYQHLVDVECVVTGMERLVVLANGGFMVHADQGPDAGAVAQLAGYIAALARARLDAFAPARLFDFLAAQAALAPPPDGGGAAAALLRAGAQTAAVAPTPAAVAAVVGALRAASGRSSHALDMSEELHETARLAALAAATLLTTTPLPQLPAECVAVCAEAMRRAGVLPPAAMTVLGHALCMHVDRLSVPELVEVVRVLVASQSSDAALMSLVAAAFHQRRAVRGCLAAICALSLHAC